MATEKEQAAQVRAAYQDVVDDIYRDPNVDPDKRPAMLTNARVKMQDQLAALRRASMAGVEDRREEILRRLSGPPNGVDVDSYRDAVVQAQATAGPALGKLLATAERIGDAGLARACFAVGLERGDGRVVSSYAAAHQGVNVDLELLEGLVPTAMERMVASAPFSAASVQ